MKSDLTLRLDKGSPLTHSQHDANFNRLVYWSGDWSAGTYQANEMVQHNNALWICLAETTVAPSLAAPSKWELLSRTEGLRWAGYYCSDPAVVYFKDDLTVYNGELLVCLNDNPEAPASTSNDWAVIAFIVNYSYIGGAPANFSPGASFTAIQNWETSKGIGYFDTPNASTGVHTLPIAAEYKVNAQIIFQQGNTNKELACLLWVRSSVAGDFVLDAIQISDDKTNWRALGGMFGYTGQAGETLQLGLSRVNQSMGSCSFQPCTFDVDMVIPAQIDEPKCLTIGYVYTGDLTPGATFDGHGYQAGYAGNMSPDQFGPNLASITRLTSVGDNTIRLWCGADPGIGNNPVRFTFQGFGVSDLIQPSGTNTWEGTWTGVGPYLAGQVGNVLSTIIEEIQ